MSVRKVVLRIARCLSKLNRQSLNMGFKLNIRECLPNSIACKRLEMGSLSPDGIISHQILFTHREKS